MNTYQTLCTQFYDIDKPDAPADALKFYMDYADKADGRIFEPMCGTGRFLIPMLQKGFDIVGSDGSPHMLSVCEEKCRRNNLKPTLHLQLLHQMNFNQKYALIFIPSGSFGLVTDVDEAKHCLSLLKDHLLPNGKLVFEVETMRTIPCNLGQHHQSTAVINNREKIVLDTIASYDKYSQVIRIACQYDYMLGNEIIRTETEDFKVRCYEANEMDAWLVGAGFNIFTKYKAFEKIEPDASDEVIIYECQI